LSGAYWLTRDQHECFSFHRALACASARRLRQRACQRRRAGLTWGVWLAAKREQSLLVLHLCKRVVP